MPMHSPEIQSRVFVAGTLFFIFAALVIIQTTGFSLQLLQTCHLKTSYFVVLSESEGYLLIFLKDCIGVKRFRQNILILIEGELKD